MKIVATAMLIGCCVLGCKTSPETTITRHRAAAVATDLANNKANELYACRPFDGSEPAKFADGFWIWKQRRGRGTADIEATVELAADGSPRRVDVLLLDSRPDVLLRIEKR